jgi:hypothetical protein
MSSCATRASCHGAGRDGGAEHSAHPIPPAPLSHYITQTYEPTNPIIPSHPMKERYPDTPPQVAIRRHIEEAEDWEWREIASRLYV